MNNITLTNNYFKTIFRCDSISFHIKDNFNVMTHSQVHLKFKLFIQQEISSLGYPFLHKILSWIDLCATLGHTERGINIPYILPLFSKNIKVE